MTKADIYIQKYKEYETIARSVFDIKKNESLAYELPKKPGYGRYKADIEYCQDIRNILQHREKLNKEFAIEPNDAMIAFLENLINRLQNRKKCADICILNTFIYSCTSESLVKEVMQKMTEKLYTYVPLMENGVVRGVFDENSMFRYIAEEEIVAIDTDLKIKDLEKYVLPLEREMEDFIFVKKNMYVDELQEIIQDYTQKGKRVGAVFVTENGKNTEKVFGLITPWDIIGM